MGQEARPRLLRASLVYNHRAPLGAFIEPFFEMQTELIKKCGLPLSFFNIDIASSQEEKCDEKVVANLHENCNCFSVKRISR